MIKSLKTFIPNTSFYGNYVTASLNDMKRLFGDPKKDIEDKTQYEWALEVNNIPCYVYDWKQGKTILANDIINWHIGVKSKKDGEIISKILNNIIRNG